MRFFKRLFSRFALVALTIIAIFIVDFLLFVGSLAAVDIALMYFFPNASVWVARGLTALSWIIVAVSVLHAANRDMVPETKIPWILCIIVLNVMGVAIYVTFSSNRPTKQQRKLYKALDETLSPHIHRTLTKEQTEEALGKWSSVSEALYAVNPAAILHGNTKTNYYPSGEKFFEALLSDLEKAKKFIFIETFIIKKGKIWSALLDVLSRKAKEGVEVRVMYDDVGSMGMVPASYPKELEALGIRCRRFNPFKPVITNLHNNRDHRKIAVIDGTVGYTGGINLADEYANLEHPFGEWKDAGVRLEGEGVQVFTLMFLRMFGLQAKQIEDVDYYLPEPPAFEGEGYVQPYGDGPSPLYGRHLGEDVYINILNTARRYVWITTPYLIIDYRMREALVLAAQRGVDVRLLTPHIPDKKVPFALTRSNYMALIQGGVKVYEYTPGFVHAKCFLADDEAGVVGTINLDYRSFLFHFEDAVFLSGGTALKELKADFEATFPISELQTEESAKRSVVWRGICELAKIFAPLF